MKKIITTGILCFLSLLSLRSFGQCNVSCNYLEDGTKYCIHSKEELYKNPDLAYGILVAHIQLAAIGAPAKGNNSQFLMFVYVGAKGSKEMVIPRNVDVYFTDGTEIHIMAQELQNPQIISGIYMQQGNFDLDITNYQYLKTKSISKFVIRDHRKNLTLECFPYRDILKEQIHCLNLKLQ